MEKARLSIGGIGVTLTGGANVALAMCLPGMEVFALPEPNAAGGITITLDGQVALPECRWLHSFSLEATGTEARFGMGADGCLYHTFGGGMALRYDPRRPDAVVCSAVADPWLLRYVLWTAYGMAALHRGAVPVHSSAVVCDGKAVLCLGESGTGKSTHTRLWRENIAGAFLLNDDSPIVRAEADGIYAYGSPWSGKTPCFRQERYPVAALLRIVQRPENTIKRLGVVEAFAALQPSCPPALAHDEGCMDMTVDFISRVVERVPVYRLGCLPDADAARLSHDTIFPAQP